MSVLAYLWKRWCLQRNCNSCILSACFLTRRLEAFGSQDSWIIQSMRLIQQQAYPHLRLVKRFIAVYRCLGSNATEYSVFLHTLNFLQKTPIYHTLFWSSCKCQLGWLLLWLSDRTLTAQHTTLVVNTLHNSPSDLECKIGRLFFVAYFVKNRALVCKKGYFTRTKKLLQNRPIKDCTSTKKSQDSSL
jgi:hypothetical protein